MKKALSATLFLVTMGCMHSAGLAAELLDVKPVVIGNAVSIEISADTAMAYTYYKVPGKARAVVDIAKVDPEKVEPLIVVNKGAVSNISVDKVQISGTVVSRIVFNLVSESDISVTATPDRKMLTVTFGGSTSATVKAEPKPAQPLGFDEPDAISATPLPKTATAASGSRLPAWPTVMRIPKLDPIVPVTAAPARNSALMVKGITTGESYIVIRANQPITDYKSARMARPERLIIDIAGAKTNQKSKSVSVNKFGITKVRIGESPDKIRVVIDSAKAVFPTYTITKNDDGLRINFK